MKRKFYTLMVLCFAVGFTLQAQTRHTVNPGDDLIQIAANAANDDTIMIMAGIHEANYDYIRVIDKNLVMIGEAGEEKPKVYFERINLENTEGSEAVVGLELHNIEFSGFDVDSLTGEEDTEGELVGEYFLNLDGSLLTFSDIIVKNCVIRNVHVTTLRGDRSTFTGNGFEFDNCIIYDIRDANDNNYPPFRLNKNIAFNYFTLTNTTMYNVQNNIIDCENLEGFPLEVLVDNCTFYDFGGKNPGEYMFDFKAATDLNFSVKDCIFANTADDPTADPEPVTVYGFRFPEDGPDIYTAITTTAFATDANFDDAGVDAVVWDQKLYIYEDVDPGFADPANGDFTLPEESELLAGSEEGSIIGDPRWNPIVTSVFNQRMLEEFSVYPNPATSQVIMKAEKATHINIIAITGQVVRTVKLEAGLNKINVSDLHKGLYILTDDGKKVVSKLMVK